MTRKDVFNELASLTQEITGKGVRFESLTWLQTNEDMVVPDYDVEGLLHEVCHWLVATEKERAFGNLMLVVDTHDRMVIGDREMIPTHRDVRRSERREKQACLLEMLILIDAGFDVTAFMETCQIAGLTYGEGWWAGLSNKQRQMRLYHVRKRVDMRWVPKLTDIIKKMENT